MIKVINNGGPDMAEPQNTDETQNTQNTQQQTDVRSGQENGQKANQQTNGGADNTKAIGIVGYLIPILFFLPMVMDMKDNDFAMYHANQQLNLLLFWIVGNLVSSVLTVVIIGFLLWPLVSIFGIIVMVMGIINVVNQEKKPLPLIGGISLLN
jgi:uncharacterized membrane protein